MPTLPSRTSCFLRLFPVLVQLVYIYIYPPVIPACKRLFVRNRAILRACQTVTVMPIDHDASQIKLARLN